jgi:hypothetical protein
MEWPQSHGCGLSAHLPEQTIEGGSVGFWGLVDSHCAWLYPNLPQPGALSTCPSHTSAWVSVSGVHADTGQGLCPLWQWGRDKG